MTAVEEHKCLVLHMLKTKLNGVFLADADILLKKLQAI